jgi:hypothetical protein
LHSADGNRNVVKNAEALAVIWIRVMETPANVGRPAIGERAPRREDRAASR